MLPKVTIINRYKFYQILGLASINFSDFCLIDSTKLILKLCWYLILINFLVEIVLFTKITKFSTS